MIIGREQLPAEAAEGEARALYWDDPDPLNLSGAFGAERRGYRLATGRRAGAEVWAHPDPRVQRLHELRREREVGQAIDRLRLVHREEPAHVYLLGSLPVDVTVDRLVETDDLLREVAIQAALKRHGGVLPLTPEWLLEHEPLALVPSAHGDKPGKTALGAAIARLARDAEARSLSLPTAETGCSPSCLPVSPVKIFIGDTGRHSGESALPRLWSLLQYRERGGRGGKPKAALAVHDHADPAAALSALLGREVALVPQVGPAEAPAVPVGMVLPFARVSGWEPAARSVIAVRHRMSFPELAVWDAQGRHAGWHFGLPLPARYWSEANGHAASAG